MNATSIMIGGIVPAIGLGLGTVLSHMRLPGDVTGAQIVDKGALPDRR